MRSFTARRGPVRPAPAATRIQEERRRRRAGHEDGAVLRLDERPRVERERAARPGELGPDAVWCSAPEWSRAWSASDCLPWPPRCRLPSVTSVGYQRGYFIQPVADQLGAVEPAGLGEAVVVTQRFVVSPRDQQAAVAQERVAAAEQLAGRGIGAGGVGHLGEPAARRIPELRLAAVPPQQHLAVEQLVHVQRDDGGGLGGRPSARWWPRCRRGARTRPPRRGWPTWSARTGPCRRSRRSTPRTCGCSPPPP